MSEPHWQVDATPTAAEAYEGMAILGRAVLRRRQRALLVLASIFSIFFAPLGATMVFTVFFVLVTGTEYSDLPMAAVPVTLAVFGIMTIWLMRQSFYMIAQASVRSRFGRAYQVLVDAQGIVIVTQHSRWQSGWYDVGTVRGGKHTLAIGISGIAIVVPRHVFQGPQDAVDALGMMQKWQEAAQ